MSGWSAESQLKPWRPYLAATLVIALASVLRLTFFSELARGTAYLTYYPAVVLAALFGGFLAGMLATIAAATLAFFWIQ